MWRPPFLRCNVQAHQGDSAGFASCVYAGCGRTASSFMKRFAILTLLVAGPLFAQHRVDIFVDAEGVHRSSKATFEPNVVRFEPRFDNGGGIGGGINVFMGDRVSL